METSLLVKWLDSWNKKTVKDRADASISLIWNVYRDHAFPDDELAVVRYGIETPDGNKLGYTNCVGTGRMELHFGDDLRPGENRISVAIEDEHGNGEMRRYIVTYTPEEAAEESILGTIPDGWYTIIGYARMLGIGLAFRDLCELGLEADRLSRKQKKDIIHIPEQRFGMPADAYHCDVLADVFGDAYGTT